MNSVTTLDVINTMLGVLQVEASDEAKRMAKEIVDRRVKELHDKMIEASMASKGIVV